MALHLAAHLLKDAAVSPVLNISLGTSSTFATATTDGWVVYGTHPLREISRRDFPNSSLRFVLPLAATNLLFLVGGPPSPLYPPNKVLFWDEALGRTVAELEFREEVRGIAARRDRLVVVLRRRVLIFVLGPGGMGVWREGGYETCDNPTGIVALATDEGSTLLAFPGRQPGQVQLVRLPPLDSTQPVLPPPPSHDPTTKSPYPSFSIILAHETALSQLACTPSGSLIATASQKGTLVRIWDAQSSGKLKELRRGTDSAEIFGIAFRRDGGAVCVSSDKGTVHVWDLSKEGEERKKAEAELADNPRQKQFSILKPYLPKYFSSEWSHSQFRLPPPAPPVSRLPFSLSNAAPSEGGTPGRATPTIEDDVCLCAWVDVEVEEKDPLPPSSPALSRSSSGRRGHEVDRPSGGGEAKENVHSHHPRRTSTSTLPSSPLISASSSTSRQIHRTTSSRSSATSTPSHSPAPHPKPRSSIPRTATPTSTASGATDAIPESQKMITSSQIVALTHSGGWFRISLGVQPKETKEDKTAPGFGLGKDSTSDCRLEEYRRFGSVDGW